MRNIFGPVILISFISMSVVGGYVGQPHAECVPDIGAGYRALRLQDDYVMSPDGQVRQRYVNQTGIEVWRPATDPSANIADVGQAMGRIVHMHNQYMLNPAVPRSRKRDTVGRLWCERVNDAGSRVFTSYSSTPDFIIPLRDDLRWYKKDGTTGTATFTRNSPAWYKNASGAWTQAAVNEPRFGYVYDGGSWVKRGYIGERSATNYALYSGAPATQTVNLTATGFYTLWVEGTGSCAIAASASGAATGTGWGTATDGNPVTVSITAGGNVELSTTGSLSIFQFENSPLATSYIQTTSVPATRAFDSMCIPYGGILSDDAGTIFVRYRPLKAGIGPSGFWHYLVSTGKPLIYRWLSSSGLRSDDGATVLTATLNWAPKDYRFAVTWGNSSRRVYNISDNTDITGGYDGSWNGTGTLYFGTAAYPLDGFLLCVQIWNGVTLSDLEVNGL